MNRTPPNNISQSRNDGLRYYMALIALGVTGPTVLCAYVFAVWGLTANIGLTNSFPWSAGPLSNWMIWLALALLLNLVLRTSSGRNQFSN
ncbi:MAG TPA: hypothetical protein VHZ55_10730 [Bryobacteraceae bacterium]|jgi:hypothetical protein|nr:hypothetical protein [Bryobacteraceae bacterium]